MSKILVNNNGFDVTIVDTGVTVPASSSYTIPPQDYAAFAASSDVIKALSSDPAQLILNDGGFDILIVSNAVDIIKGWPVQVVAAEDTPFFFDYADTLATNNPTTIFSQTVDPGVVLELTRMVASCRMESTIQVYKNGIQIGSLRTGAALPMASFDWRPNQVCTEGNTIEIVLTKRFGAPDIDVGVHLMGVQNNV